MMRKKLRYGLGMILALGTFVAVWRVWGEERTLSRADWAPRSGTAKFTSRTRAEVELRWDKKVPSATNNSLEIEVVLPDWKRGPIERTRVFNHLKVTTSSKLPDSCRYKDIAFWDPCENWAQGILLAPNCLEAVTPGTVNIVMDTDEVPSSVTSARLLVSRSEKGGLTDRMRVAGGASGCTAICAACQGGPVPVNWVCPPIFGQWLKDLCGQCDRAWDETTPEWNFFSASATWCAEPIGIPSSAEFIGCGAPPFGVTCDDPIRNDAPKKTCVPQERICGTGSTVVRCSNDGLKQETIEQCRCACSGGVCQNAVCEPGPPVCKDQRVKRVCATDGCGFVDTACACGCSNGVCQPVVCTSSYCRDPATLVQCTNNGCGTQVVSCGYGCSNDRCNNPSGTPPDMNTGGGPPPDMSVPPPPDLAGPITPEVCDGIDNDKNGIVDDLASCWLTVYRFKDGITGARCYGPSSSPPFACAAYVLEKALFSVPAYPWADGSTGERVQCSRGIDHVIVIKGGTEYGALLALGWNCSLSLGHFFSDGRAPKLPVRTPYPNACSVYRQKFLLPAGDSHWFTAETETVFGAVCEPPTRGEVLMNVACGKPAGC